MIEHDKGFLISCDKEGRIKKIHFNSSDIAIENFNNKLFIELFSEESISSAIEFLIKVKKHSASFGWEIFPKIVLSEEPYYFSGAIIDEEILVFGSCNKIDFNKFINQMMLINNEQVNKIRELEKTQKLVIEDKQSTNNYLFNELSRLNNELIDVQREITKKNVELAELNKLKNQFIGMVAHDLRNPLGIILNFIEFLEDEKDNFTQEQFEFICHIKTLSSFMLNLVSELLDISAIESGSIKLALESFNLVTLISQIIHLNKPFADKKSMKIVFRPEMESIQLLLDKTKIEQVVTNLLTNAIKYSPEGTTITIEIKKSNTEILISVKDEGQGIVEDELKLFFKPFQRTSSKSTGGEKSTGLGLFIVKKIVEAHKGKIWAKSEPGKGSIFYFTLPL